MIFYIISQIYIWKKITSTFFIAKFSFSIFVKFCCKNSAIQIHFVKRTQVENNKSKFKFNEISIKNMDAIHIQSILFIDYISKIWSLYLISTTFLCLIEIILLTRRLSIYLRYRQQIRRLLFSQDIFNIFVCKEHLTLQIKKTDSWLTCQPDQSFLLVLTLVFFNIDTFKIEKWCLICICFFFSILQ
jgi:hypothetical protein